MRAYKANSEAIIFVVNESSYKLGRRLEKLKKEQVLDEFLKLAKKDKKNIDLIYSKPKSIVFVIFHQLKPDSLGCEPNSYY